MSLMKKHILPLIVSVVILSAFLLAAQQTVKTYPQVTSTRQRVCTSFTVSQPIGGSIVLDATFQFQTVNSDGTTNTLPTQSITIPAAQMPANVSNALVTIFARLETVKNAQEP